MSNTFFNTPLTKSPISGLVGSLTGSAKFCFSLAKRHWRQAQNRKLLLSLSDEQLTDAGIDRSLIHKGPELLVDARVMSTLMSLR